MTDVPSASGRRFHTSASGELRHNSIQDRLSNHSSSDHHHDDSSDDDRHRQQQQQQTPTLNAQKPPLSPGGDAPMRAVQVVDRLRWWRTRRVREQPIPVHHYVLRGNYTNYSSFGTRPLAPGLTRLLQQARNVRAHYQGHQQHLQRQQRLQRGVSVANSSIDDTEHQHQQQSRPEHEQLTREESDMPDNKRVSTAPAAPLDSPPSSPTHVVAEDAAAGGAVGPSVTAVPPLSVAAIDSSVGSASLRSTRGLTAQEVHEAERLLRLYQPRSFSVPVRSRRQRRVAGYGGGGIPLLQQAGSSGIQDRASQPLSLTRVPTSDDMTEVCRAAGAAESVVVLHHEPRLIIYERDVKPRTALRAARVSSDALEGLRDAATESSAEVFALTNLPLSGFERFFYQQQLREGRTEDVAVAPMAGLAATQSGHVGTGVPDSAGRTLSAFPSSPLAGDDGGVASGGCEREESAFPPGYGVVNREDALYFGSPMTARSPMYSPQMQVPALLTSSPAEATTAATAVRNARQPPSATHGTADQLGAMSSGVGAKGTRRRQQWASLRAVSVPCLPRVYKSGCPSLLPPAEASSSAAAVPESRPSRSGQCVMSSNTSNHHRRYLLPPALRSADRPRDGAHLCHRVDDLQDAYAFNPVFDAIGKGAFSKVYAAVPILRGRAGMRRFNTLDTDDKPASSGMNAAATTTALALSADGKEGKAATHCAEVLSRSTTPTISPAATELKPEGLRAGGASVTAASASAQRYPSVRSVPVVALKVIPRKARQREQQQQQARVDSPTSPAQPSQLENGNADANNNNSVRRELVEIEREVSILRRLHHTGCSHFYEALRSPDAFVIAMRIYPGSMDARHYLSRHGPPSEARTALALFQLVSTVHYLHTYFGLIHRDIKLENLLFSEVDPRVPSARIGEVLGSNVRKADPSSAEDDLLSGLSPRDGEAGLPSSASHAYEVLRLLRVTLIDFGLARRTRTVGMSANVSRIRGGGGATTRTQSLSASMNSPSNMVAGFAGPIVEAVGGANTSVISAFNLHSPGVPPPPPPPATNGVAVTGSAVSVQAQSQRAPPMVAGSAGASTMVSPTAFAATGTRGGNSSYAAMPAMPPPLCPPRFRRSSSTAACGAGASTGAARAGMPSPMPSTANMFTRFLDLDEDLDEEDSIANGVSTTGYPGGVAQGCTELVGCGNSAYEASVTSPHMASSRRRASSRTGFPVEEEESAVSSTDVSASETDSESAEDDEASVRSGTASLVEEAALEAGAAARTATPMEQLRRDGAPTPTRAAATVPPTLPSPHTPQRLSSEGSSQTATGGGGGGGAGGDGSSNAMSPTPPTLFHRPPPSVHVPLRDDAEAALLLTPCGTEKYLPPEVLSWILERGWTRRSTTVGLARAMDMYAIGIVAYVLLSGCFPFNASSRATLLQQQQRVPRCNSARWSGVSSEAVAFVQRLLEPNPLKRMTAKEALEHPFMLEARQLAEKLALVPHGEGEEAHRSDDGGDGQLAGRSNGPNGGSACHNNSANGNASGGYAVLGTNTLRAHWSSAARPVPSTSAAVVGGPHSSSSLASPIKGNNPASFSLPGRSAFSKSITPDASFVATTTATTAVGPSDAGGAGLTVLSCTLDAPPPPPLIPAQKKNGGEGAGKQSTSQDMFAAMSEEVMADERPVLSPLSQETLPQRRRQDPAANDFSSPQSPSPLLHGTMASTPSAAAQAAAVRPGMAPAAKPRQSIAPLLPMEETVRMRAPAPTAVTTSAAKTESAISPQTSPALPKAKDGSGGGDDLFESLYNNIMFND